MFTREDVRDIAVQIEHNAETSYRQASRKAKNARIAQTLEWMADQEKNHAQWFARLAPLPNIAVQNRELAEMGRELLLGSIQNQTFSLDPGEIAEMEQIQEVLEKSIEFENDTILFYEMLLGFMDDSATMRQLEVIIEEERKHIDTINGLMSHQDPAE